MTSRFDQLPSALRRHGYLERLGSNKAPALLVPAEGGMLSAPMVIWLHGRTAYKELDPGRYLRLIRSGISVCAVDLPGHGERIVPEMQESPQVLDVVLQMADELDEITSDATERLRADPDRIGLGGMSAGGMATLTRLCSPHHYAACSVEATTGNWTAETTMPMLQATEATRIAQADPIRHLANWREIPFQAFHTRADEWVPYQAQKSFITALQAHYHDPDDIEFVTFDQTGALHEHAGFGRYSAEVKEQQRRFFCQHLLDTDKDKS
ncbi:MAG: alpha/beta fold hydrolase [Phycisphaerales bacterium]|nr:alpha/beta fold hydrolase [Phycisphaerales bacterium]